VAIKTTEQAKKEIQDDAAARAYAYLEREAPRTLKAIVFLVTSGKWKPDVVLDFFTKTYGPTEEKTMHKIRLVVEALVRERDE
jgi:hypothetical protein